VWLEFTAAEPFADFWPDLADDFLGDSFGGAN
jgi:hypothetical protein